jgi:hypothetical protein
MTGDDSRRSLARTAGDSNTGGMATGRQKRTGERESDRRQLLIALARSESDAFIAEIGNAWRASAERARLAVAATPEQYKRDVLLSHLDGLSNWLFTRVRESLITRVDIGRAAKLGHVERLLRWGDAGMDADFATALLPEANGTEVPQFDKYLEGLVKGWLGIACAGWRFDVGQLMEWRAPAWAARRAGQRDVTEDLLKTSALIVGAQVDSAKNLAREAVVNGVLSEAFTRDAGKREAIHEKLRAKKGNISDRCDTSGLTDNQRQCLELRFDYELSIPEIAIHLGKARKTIYEHLSRAAVILDRARLRDATARKRAKVNPGNLDPTSSR